MSKENVQENTCDPRVLQAIKFRIIKLERDNAKEKKLNDSKMVSEIEKIIEEEVNRQ